MKILEHSGKLIKAWVDHVPIEEDALKQLYNVSKLPFVYRHIAVMPDVHWGMGCTVGSVIATKGAIVPAAVGVDIGCGMIAMQTPIMASDLPDNLFELRSEIERQIPHGRTNDGGPGDRGSWHDIPKWVEEGFISRDLFKDYETLINHFPEIKTRRHPMHQLSTLGTGNHFVEICIDENQKVWIMLHSGSRGIGNRIGNFFISKAKEEMQKYYIDSYLPDQDLSYIVEKSELFNDYMFALDWAQRFAETNRMLMLYVVKTILQVMFCNKIAISAWSEGLIAVNCHHNYVSRENHFGSNVLVTRKGAVSARAGQLGIIPGSMGAKSFIVRGKGNPESFHSCSHGAGRSMSRNQAKKQFTIEDHIKATEGVECRKDAEVIDETPMAYKSIDDVMRSQEDLVDIVATLKQVICVKG